MTRRPGFGSRRRPRALAGVATASGIALGLALAACATSPAAPAVDTRPLLNSERIAATFGSYGGEVLAASERARVSSLYSLHDGRRVGRTFAVVRFSELVDPRLAEAHDAIVAGGSLGATLVAHGWEVEKEHLYLGTLTPREELAAVYRRMAIAPSELAVHVYRLAATRPGVELPYATLAEVHHPDYLALDDLRALYDPDGEIAGEPSPEVETVLRLVADAAVALAALPAAQT